MPERHKHEAKHSGAKKEESFWDENYRPHRYRQDDGSMMSVIDQVLIEESIRSQRFDPGTGGLKLRKGDLPF